MKKGQCKHFNGIQNKTCDAGVQYTSVPRLKIIGICCLGPDAGHCKKYQEPTNIEIKAYDDETRELFEKSERWINLITPIMKKIKEKYRRKNMSGFMTCPICKKAKGMHVRHSGYNGHIAVWCETEGCMRMME